MSTIAFCSVIRQHIIYTHAACALGSPNCLLGYSRLQGSLKLAFQASPASSRSAIGDPGSLRVRFFNSTRPRKLPDTVFFADSTPEASGYGVFS